MEEGSALLEALEKQTILWGSAKKKAEMRRVAGKAIELAAELGDPTEARITAFTSRLEIMMHGWSRAEKPDLERAVSVAMRHGVPEVLFLALTSLAFGRFSAGRLGEAR